MKEREPNRQTIATACLFLAGKVEETPKKVSELILAYYKTIHNKKVTTDSPEFIATKKKIFEAERKVLAVISFDLTIEHPYTHLINFVKELIPAEDKRKEVAQSSWGIINDQFKTTLCIQYKPKAISCAALSYAAAYHGEPLPSHWYDKHGVTKEELDGK